MPLAQTATTVPVVVNDDLCIADKGCTVCVDVCPLDVLRIVEKDDGIEVHFEDPDGHCLEIYWGLDQVGSDGRVRPPEQWREAQSLGDAIANPPQGQDTTLHDASLEP